MLQIKFDSLPCLLTSVEVQEWVRWENEVRAGDSLSPAPICYMYTSAAGSASGFDVTYFEFKHHLQHPSTYEYGPELPMMDGAVTFSKLEVRECGCLYTGVETWMSPHTRACNEDAKFTPYGMESLIRRMFGTNDISTLAVSSVEGVYGRVGRDNSPSALQEYLARTLDIEAVLITAFNALAFVGLIRDDYQGARSLWCHEVWRALQDRNHTAPKVSEKYFGQIASNPRFQDAYQSYMEQLDLKRRILPASRITQEQFYALAAYLLRIVR